MKLPNLVSAASHALLISRASAGKFSQPVFSNKVISSVLIPQTSDDGGNQKILKDPRPRLYGPAFSHGLPIQSLQTFLYTTNISLGTPPQSIPAIIDTTWSDLFAPSVTCGGSHRCAEKAKFNSSASSSFHEVGTIKRTTYGPVFAYGKESVDTLTLGNLSVPKQHFQELSYYEEVYPDNDLEGWDSVLGLSWERDDWMDDPRSPNTLPSPFKTIVESEVLDQNIFSLKLPRNESDVGDIVFGGSNEDLFVQDSMVYHPLYPENTTQWQVQISGVSLVKADGSHHRRETIMNASMKSYSAMLITATHVLGFPQSIGEDLLSQLPHEPSACGRQMVIPCSKVANLPDLVISFAGGQDVVLKGADYVMEITLPWCREPVVECMPLIESLPENIPGIEFPRDFMILGSGFLKSVYAVFDWDERRVDFGKLK